jgi:hypothetical protein
MRGVRPVMTLARGIFFVFGAFALLLGGGLTLIAATVGVCAAAGLLLYGVAHLFVYLFGVSFRWGLVSTCGLLFLGLIGSALIHDLRVVRRLALPKASPPQAPQFTLPG